MRWIVCLIFTLFAPALWAGPAPKLIIMEPEIEGDTSDPAQKAAWPGRLENLQAEMQRGLAEAGLYDVLDPSVAEAEFAKHRLRRGVFSCKPCIRSVAEAADADRVLSLQVHRMSQLVISLQAVIRDADTLNVRYARYISFRNDTDLSWQQAADAMLEMMQNEIPDDQR